MNLYLKDGNNIKVYNLKPKKEEIIEYKKEQIKTIPEERRFAIAMDYLYTLDEKPYLVKNENDFDDTLFPQKYDKSKEGKKGYHEIISDNKRTRNEEILLDSYFYGHLDDRPLIRTHSLGNIRNYLLYSLDYNVLLYPDCRCLDKIIELPENLYLLQMILQGKHKYFKYLKNIFLEEQLALFTLKYLDKINLSNIKKMDNCGITERLYETTIKKAEEDDVLLKVLSP